VLNVEQVPPPPNDDFATAKAIDTRPFVDQVDLTSATTEPSEPDSAEPGLDADRRQRLVRLHSGRDGVGDRQLQLLLRVPDARALHRKLARGPDRDRVAIVRAADHVQAMAGTTYYFQLGRGFLQGGRPR
jgi:hypothetical protein